MSNDYVKGRWTEAETNMLKRLLLEHLQIKQNIDAYDLGIIINEQQLKIPWSLISKKMVKRSRLSCFKKWQKMTKVKSKSNSRLECNVGIASSPVLTPKSFDTHIESEKEYQLQLSSQNPNQSSSECFVSASQSLHPDSITDKDMINVTNHKCETSSTITINRGDSSEEFDSNMHGSCQALDSKTHVSTNISSRNESIQENMRPNLDQRPEDAIEHNEINLDTCGVSNKNEYANMEEHDLYLLQQLSDISSNKRSQVENSSIWANVRHPYGASERWKALLEEMKEENDEDACDSYRLLSHFCNQDATFDSKGAIVAKIANLMLERRKKKAAVVVEAVNLPFVGQLPNTITGTSYSNIEHTYQYDESTIGVNNWNSQNV